MQRALKRKKEYIGKCCLFLLVLMSMTECSGVKVLPVKESPIASVSSMQMVGKVSSAQLLWDNQLPSKCHQEQLGVADLCVLLFGS